MNTQPTQIQSAKKLTLTKQTVRVLTIADKVAAASPTPDCSMVEPAAHRFPTFDC
jgi:hypothetical protein